MGKKKKSKTTPRSPEPEPGLGALAAALSAGGLRATAPVEAPPIATSSGRSEAPTGTAPDPAPLRGKVVVRRERKGRGGKTATILEGAAITSTDRAALAKRLRKALGCGAREEGDAVVVQGDQRDAAKAWLEREGLRVVVGN